MKKLIMPVVVGSLIGWLLPVQCQQQPGPSGPATPPPNAPVHRLPPRAERQNSVPTVTKPPSVSLGPDYSFVLPNGVRISVLSTNTFTSAELRRWLREAMISVR